MGCPPCSNKMGSHKIEPLLSVFCPNANITDISSNCTCVCGDCGEVISIEMPCSKDCTVAQWLLFLTYTVKQRIIISQVVICSNRCRSSSKVSEILVHELIHMYDNCTASIDFNRLKHLACTEVRAANLAHCTTKGDTRNRARASLYAVINDSLTQKEIPDALAEVFDRCYQDLEPFGRRPCTRETSQRAYEEFIYLRNLKKKCENVRVGAEPY